MFISTPGNEAECRFCSKPLFDGQRVAGPLGCRHLFHPECIKRAYRAGIDICPHCSRKFDEDSTNSPNMPCRSYPWSVKPLQKSDFKRRMKDDQHRKMQHNDAPVEESSAEINLTNTVQIASEEVKCPICLDVLVGREVASPEGCIHLFHLECIDRSHRYTNRRCPICRREFNIVNVQRQFDKDVSELHPMMMEEQLCRENTFSFGRLDVQTPVAMFLRSIVNTQWAEGVHGRR